jgi:hypothetical protein
MKKKLSVPPLPDEKLKDFRNYLFYVWHLLEQIKRDPTEIQYDIAQYMQHGPKRCIIEGFRGIGKSWICSAFVTHQLLLDPTKNILVVSASKTRADDFSTFTLRLLTEIPVLKHLVPTADQRFSKVSFDVGPAPASHAPSVKSLGITSQLTGSRADLIIADDIEVPTNSATQAMRDKLSEQIKEFDAILKPHEEAKVMFLGTPQCEDSVYTKLPERGYQVRIWPAEHVSIDTNTKTYGDAVSPLCVSNDKVGETTEPSRFSDFDLKERQISYGRQGYALQFMLNPSLSDLDRYPLKLKDLVITTVQDNEAVEKPVWGDSPDLVLPNLPNIGMRGDRFLRPFRLAGDMVPYSGSVMSIDPSGRGQDETGYAVVKMLDGRLYVPKAGGLKGGYDEATLQSLALTAAQNKVNKIVVESNFGDGMFTQLFKPVLNKIYPCGIEEVRHSIQKEKRIIDTLEPVIAGHRLIIDPKVVEDDYSTIQSYPPERQLRYSLFYQLTRITYMRGSLTQDDRLDALAIAVAYWVEQMAVDAQENRKERQNEALDAELTKFKESYFKTRSNPQERTWLS